jgi:hypothetical protein
MRPLTSWSLHGEPARAPPDCANAHQLHSLAAGPDNQSTKPIPPPPLSQPSHCNWIDRVPHVLRRYPYLPLSKVTSRSSYLHFDKYALLSPDATASYLAFHSWTLQFWFGDEGLKGLQQKDRLFGGHALRSGDILLNLAAGTFNPARFANHEISFLQRQGRFF